MSRLTWTGDDAFTVGDVAFRIQDLWAPLAHPAVDDEFVVFKPIHLADRYADLLGELQPRNVVELGILNGGSTVLLTTLTDLRKLAAVELSPSATPSFAEWVERQDGRVAVHFGVDQADQGALRRILAEDFGDDLLDLVVDDASHLLAPSRASFDVLFPHLRPGGLYLIEDWTIHHEMERLFADPELRAGWEASPGAQSEHVNALVTEPPLSLLLFEASLSMAFSGVIDEVSISRNWAIVRRGSEPVDPATFKLDDLVMPKTRARLNGL